MKRICFALLMLTACGEKTSHELPASAFQQQIEATEDAVVLDVRTTEEVNAGFIEGAVHIDYNGDDFESKVNALDKSKTYFIYCGSGVRSSKAGDVMKDLGFGKFYTLEGGIKAWKEKGLPVVK